MSVEKLDSVFRELDLMGVPRVGVTGGEPFMREDILDILNLLIDIDLLRF